MAMKSWLPVPRASHFSLANIPFGIISTPTSSSRRPAVAIGEHVLDLHAFSLNNGFAELPSIQQSLSVFYQPTLNAFAALGRTIHRDVRKYLQDIFTEDTELPHVLKTNASLQKLALLPSKEVATHLPMHIGDYTDFYAGRNHAYNVGVLFRGPNNALQPNYTHIPVGYHGRASSVVVSGTPIRRPWGQILEHPTAESKAPTFTPCKRLDIELELGAFVCRANRMGEPIPVAEAEQSLFGYVLLNDWSARDIQAWEYVPLGPFNAKNFGTTISAWVVLADALEPFICKGLDNETELQPYLREEKEESVFDINLEVDLTSTLRNHKNSCFQMELMMSIAPSGITTTITSTSSKNLLFSFRQMLAHHSITGCPMQVGDLLGSGTISGAESGTQGSLLEQCENGKSTLKLEKGEERTFLEDGDTVTIRGWAGKIGDGSLVGFGECLGRIEAAIKLQSVF
ncbi:hypothetical protein MMC06_001436 [Schaereria dolodes]|nr:hypothetical protein [Schaereria dolodes]